MAGASRILARLSPWRTVPTTQAGQPSLKTYLNKTSRMVGVSQILTRPSPYRTVSTVQKGSHPGDLPGLDL